MNNKKIITTLVIIVALAVMIVYTPLEVKAAALESVGTRYIFTVGGLNIRESGDINSAIIGSYSRADEVEVIAIDRHGWARVEYNNREAYISSVYLSKFKPPQLTLTKQYATTDIYVGKSDVVSTGSAHDSSEFLTSQTEPTSTGKRYLGSFTLSHYCPCAKCCGVSTGITASGTTATINRTVGVDTRVIPFGTRLLINGQEYIAEDTGSGVNGNWIDIFVAGHQEAINLGLKTADVYIVE